MKADYLHFLKDELSERVRRNPHYSQRAFARDLGLSPSRLSEILSGKQGLSRSSAQSIGKKLGLQPGELDRFCDLVELLHSRSKNVRKHLEEKYKNAPAHTDSGAVEKLEIFKLQQDAYRLIEDWYPLAILQLLKMKSPPKTNAEISKRLGLSLFQVNEAIERMLRLEILEIKGKKTVPTAGWVMIDAGIPHLTIKKFHEQILAKASRTLFEESMDRRNFRSSVLSIDPKRLPEISKKMTEFSDKIIAEFNTFQDGAEVSALSLQFFPLSKSMGDAQ